jgi:hypothetical protein
MDIVTVYALRQLYEIHGCATVFAAGQFLKFEEENDYEKA